MKFLILVLFLIANLICNSMALQCYQCKTLTSCKEAFAEADHTLESCTGDNNACAKSITKSSAGTTVLRGCSATCSTQTCTGSNSYESKAYYCTSDKCNSGDALKFKGQALLLAVFSSIFAFKLFA